MHKKLDFDAMIRDNPGVDPEKLTEVLSNLQTLRALGVADASYNIASPFSAPRTAPPKACFDSGSYRSQRERR